MTAAAPEGVTVQRDGSVATVLLDRPQRRNAWTAGMAIGFTEALNELDADSTVGAIVLTGAGTAFCGGLDLNAMPSFDADKRPEPATLPWHLGKPVIAAINGHAVGVGLTLALTADVRYVLATAKLQLPFVRLGLVGELGSHALLPRIVGWSNAADLMLSGRPISGTEAVELGLASRCFDTAEEVVAAASDWARDVADNTAPEAVAMSKAMLVQALAPALAEIAPQEVTALGQLAARPEAQARLGGMTRGVPK